MEEIFKRILSETGLAGSFVILLLLSVWKLYKDLQKAKDSKYNELKALKDITESKYRESMQELNATIKEFNTVLDRMFDFLMTRRK